MSPTARLELPPILSDGEGRPRYILRERIGMGGEGQVYRAFDTHAEREVALKALRDLAPEHVMRIKGEFRSLLDVAHPNLVRLRDLVVSDEAAFFTMELVDGVELLEWCWQGNAPPLDACTEHLLRIQSSFSQLALALAALHRHGRLHRDLKPNNVLVAPSAKLTLLDLGLSVELASLRGRRAMEGHLAGTLDYMSPEQATRRVLGPESDWFGFGALLHQALTGKVPPRIAGHKVDQAAAQTELLACKTPESLTPLVLSLLDSQPNNRASLSSVLDVLSADRTTAVYFSGFYGFPYIGRESELAALQDSLRASRNGRPQVVSITATAGMGKTALLTEFLRHAELSGALVLRGRCHFREKVPYKALDGLIDDLSGYLRTCSSAQLADVLPARMYALQAVFPSLRRIPGGDASRFAQGVSASERHVAFVALGKLLTAIARTRPLVLAIDDLHWADHDSLRALQTLLLGSARGFLVLLSYRPEGAPLDSVLHHVLAGIGVERYTTIELPALLDRAVEAIVRNVGEVLTDIEVRTCVALARGNPWLAREFSRVLRLGPSTTPWSSLDESALVSKLVADRLRDVSEAAYLLFGLLAVSGFPLDERLLGHLPQLGPLAPPLGELISSGLVVYVMTRNRPHLTVAHEYLRDGYLALQAPQEHLQLEELLRTMTEQEEESDPFPRVELLANLGSSQEAAEVALKAARAARQRSAFNLAAQLMERHMALLPNQPAWELLKERGEILCEAGRVREGMLSFVRASTLLAAQERTPRESVMLLALAGERLCSVGCLEEGVEATELALGSLNIRLSLRKPLRALLWALANRPRLYFRKLLWRLRGRRRGPDDEHTELALRVLWAAGTAVGPSSPFHGMEYHVRHALLAYQAGNLEHIALSLGMDSMVMAMLGGRHSATQSESVARRAHELATNSGNRLTLAFLDANMVARAHFIGDFRKVVLQSERVLEHMKTFPQELSSQAGLVRFLTLNALAHLGRVAEARSLGRDWLLQGEMLGDQAALSWLKLGTINFSSWLCWDEPELAQAQLESAERLLPIERLGSVDYQSVLGWINLHLYRGEADQAVALIERRWGRLAQALQLRLSVPCFELYDARARAFLTLALSAGPSQRPELLRLARQAIARLAKSDLRISRASAQALKACLLLQGGSEDHAARLLLRAREVFLEEGLALRAGACRKVLETLTPRCTFEGDADQRAIEEVANVPRLVKLLLPHPLTTAEVPKKIDVGRTPLLRSTSSLGGGADDTLLSS